jgi:hypothetical protein
MVLDASPFEAHASPEVGGHAMSEFDKLIAGIADAEIKTLLESWRHTNPATSETEYPFALTMLIGLRIDTPSTRTMAIRYVQAFERMRTELGATPSGREKLRSIMAPLMSLPGMS